jgi:uncharacterized protein (TIGR02246 family)
MIGSNLSFAFAFVVLMLTGWTSPSVMAQTPPAQDDRAAIAAQSKRLSDAYVQGDIESLVSIYTTDGVAVPGSSDPVRGREALLKLWSLPEGRTILRHSSTPTEIQIDGDHAYDWGIYEGQASRNGEPQDPFKGNYVIVWQRGGDGIWRIAIDMWNSQ